MLVGRVIDHKLGDDAYTARTRGVNETPHVGHRSVIKVDGAVIADVIAVIESRRGIEGQQPDRRRAEAGNVIELGNDAGKSPIPSSLELKNDFT